MTLAAFADVTVIALDLDGVVYHGRALLPGADTAVAAFRRRGYAVRFLTNASGVSREHIAAKLTRLGVPASPGDIYTSAMAVSALLTGLGARLKTACVCGTSSLAETVREAGARLVTDEPADALVVGFDEGFTYATLATALACAHAETVFIASNRDITYPAAGGVLRPGCGPLVAAVECVLRRPADYVAGKPGETMLRMLCADLGVTPGQVLMVGDTPESDIAMAKRAGAIGVLCGACRCPEDIAPDYTVAALREVPALLSDGNG